MSLRFPEKYEVKNLLGIGRTFRIKFNGLRLTCIASIDDGLWEHVSVTVSYPGKKSERCPTWDETCFVKNLFWDDEDEVIQFYPKKSQYVNLRQSCLHLWRPVGGFPIGGFPNNFLG